MGLLSEYKQMNKLLQDEQQIVFYTESRHYYQYFEKLISDILNKSDAEICYITSDNKDPLLQQENKRLKVIYSKWVLGFLFSKIKAKIMIMTMPDLDNFLFKRSIDVGDYIYMFHAAVSTHQQYRKEAFFNYDTVFCTGDYQVSEIRKAEKLYKKKQKNLIQYGYPLIDKVKAKQLVGSGNKPVILVAPSWFSGCIFESCFEELIRQLSTLPYVVFIRSHPEYERREKKKFDQIKKLISNYPNISIDDNENVMDSLPAANILITDRSGIAFEFAFGTNRPVLFIDTILKKTNPDWKELESEPVENSYRSQLGISLQPENLNLLPQKIEELKLFSQGFKEKITAIEKNLFYNNEAAFKSGLEYVIAKL